MKKRWKRIIGFLLVVSFLLPGEAGHFSLVTGKLARAMDTGKSITMEEYYNEGNYGIRVQADTSVTISSPEEFLMFRQCIKDGQTYWDGGENGFIGVQFCQTKDIHFADFKAEYSKSWKRMVLTKPDGEEIGSIDVDGKCYSASATTTAIAPEELGLSDALMLTGRKQDSEADTSFIEAFRGNYDGQGYTLSGLLLLTGLEAVLDEDGDKLQQGYCVEGIFGNDNRGCIYNLTLKNICAIEAENGILTRLNSGVIKDCRLENSTIWSRYDGGGLVETNNTDGEISGIDIEACQVYLEAGFQGDFGGIAGTQRGKISHCQSKDSLMQDVLSVKGNDSFRMAGWIAGDGYHKIYQCYNYSKIKVNYDGKFGGIAGRFIGDFLSYCGNKGSIKGYAVNKTCYLGGIVASFGDGVLYQCYNEGDIHAGADYISGKSTEPVDMLGGGFCYIGGIAAIVAPSGNKSTLEFSGCSNKGNVIAAVATCGVNAGGIAGYIYNARELLIRNCVNSGLIDFVVVNREEEASCGGLIGRLERNEGFAVKNSYNLGQVGTSNCYQLSTTDGYNPFHSESDNIGGLVGQIIMVEDAEDLEQFLENCYNKGKVYDTGGHLVGRGQGTALSRCYYFSQEYELPVIKVDEGCVMTDCGEADGGLRESLNDWVTDNNRNEKLYLSYVEEGSGYPVFDNSAVLESDDDYVIDTPSIKEYPLLTPTPEVTVIPSESPDAGTVITMIPPETPDVGTVDTTVPSETMAATWPAITMTPSETPYIPASMSAMLQESSEPASSAAPSKQTCKLQIKNSFRVKISWTDNPQAEGYEIYRSRKKKKGYQKIKEVPKGNLYYIDRKVKKGKKYFYKVSAFWYDNQQKIRQDSPVRKVTVPWYQAPKLLLKKGVSPQGQKYIQITLKKYKASHLEIYLKRKGQKFTKVKLNSSKIKAYKGKPKLSYSWKKVTVYFKVRTYQVKNGKKRYSAYSKQKKIKL